jgi:hypothetical protein
MYDQLPDCKSMDNKHNLLEFLAEMVEFGQLSDLAGISEQLGSVVEEAARGWWWGPWA